MCLSFRSFVLFIRLLVIVGCAGVCISLSIWLHGSLSAVTIYVSLPRVSDYGHHPLAVAGADHVYLHSISASYTKKSLFVQAPYYSSPFIVPFPSLLLPYALLLCGTGRFIFLGPFLTIPHLQFRFLGRRGGLKGVVPTHAIALNQGAFEPIGL